MTRIQILRTQQALPDERALEGARRHKCMKMPACPTWLLEVAQNSSLKAKDLLPIFGYANRSSLATAVASGAFPQPDFRAGPKKKSVCWYVSTVRKEIRRRQKMLEGE